jgi:LmbE family N-acetylglucosaminyl deacetylase
MSAHRRFRRAVAIVVAALAPSVVAAQGAVTVHELASGLGTTVRVLMIGAHPDDEDTQLLTWLARGRHADAAYLSLTRGDGGQNAIGNELGEALGAIRTEELLAARRVDGARQYFTRAYDFGFSKSVEETLKHWPRDSILGDVVKVVRAMRPHVIVAVFSGTARDGHGHHQVSGLLAREVFDLAADTKRFPVAQFGAAWTPQKFYRAARFNATAATLGMDVGGYDPVRGRGLGELAAESRSQHRSQGFGTAPRRGTVMDYVRLEASRVSDPAAKESDILDGLRAPRAGDAASRAPVATVDSLRRAIDLRAPWTALPLIERARQRAEAWCTFGAPAAPIGEICRGSAPIPATMPADTADAVLAGARVVDQLRQLAVAASGLLLEATVDREFVAEGDSATLTLRVTNRGPRTARAAVFTPTGQPMPADTIAPGGELRVQLPLPRYPRTRPWWLAEGRLGDIFRAPAAIVDDEARADRPVASVPALVDGITVQLRAPILFARVDETRGEVTTPLAVVPRVSVVLDGGATSLARAGAPLVRDVVVRVTGFAQRPESATVALTLPGALRADAASQRVFLLPGVPQAVTFRVRGTLPAGRHELRATVTAGGATFAEGFQRVAYEHIRPQHLYAPATQAIVAVPSAAPPAAPVGYIAGLADNVPRALAQLGVTVVPLDPATLDAATLERVRTIVVGPRALEGQPALLGRMPLLHEWVRGGGTLVVQYQQTDIARPGASPFALTFARPADRVTEEDAPIAILRPDAPLLTSPNRITADDWRDWVQERSLYMPRTADAALQPLLGMNDPGEPQNPNALLVAPLGKGTYVYTSLALFRQLPAGVPGAARLFVNLLSAGSAGVVP